MNLGQLQLGRVIRTTSYGSGPYIIRAISGPCECPDYHDAINTRVRPAPRSEQHYHLTAEREDRPGVMGWFNGYRPDGTCVWSKDYLIFGDLAPGTQQQLF